jgi:type II secretory pathway pseudopilin PulG
MVVMSVISLMSSVVVTSTDKAKAKARDSSRIQLAAQVRNGLELYKSNTGSYPVGFNTAFELASGPLSGYLNIPSSNQKIAEDVDYYSDGTNYELMVDTEQTSHFNQGSGCGSNDYNTYDNGTNSTYCLGTSPSGNLVTSAVTLNISQTFIHSYSEEYGDRYDRAFTWSTTGATYCELVSASDIDPVSGYIGPLPTSGYIIPTWQMDGLDYYEIGLSITIMCRNDNNVSVTKSHLIQP